VNVWNHSITRGSESARLTARAGRPAREKRLILYACSLFFDCASLLIGYLVALFLRDEIWLETGGQPLIGLALPIFLMFELAREVQSVEALESRSLGTQRALGALVATALVVLGLSFLFKDSRVSRVGFLATFGIAAIVLILGKIILAHMFARWMEGKATAAVLLQDGMVVEPARDCDLVDVEGRGLWPDHNQPSSIEELSRIISPYDRVVVSCRYERRSAWATFLQSQGVGGEILLDRDMLHGAVAIGTYGGDDTLILSRGPLSLSNRIQKRAFDLVVAAVALITLAPIMLAIAVGIKLDSPGPVLFRQVRVGEGSQRFQIFKFRSMRIEATDEDGHTSTQRHDPRITVFGSFIRRTSLDELPQLLNVLRGEMSLVGPRPHALGSLAGDALFWQVTQMYWIRHALKPGITGLAQIRGHRGATESSEALQHRVRADLEYVANWSLVLDIVIILRTLRVLVHRNAY